MSKRSVPSNAVRNVAYYDNLIARIDRAFAGADSRAWRALERSEQEPTPPPEPSPLKSR